MFRLSLHNLFLLGLLLLFYTGVSSQLKLPSVFSDNMVLQRDKPLPVWGKANPGSSVTVSFLTQQKSSIADKEGNWKVVLDPLLLSVTPADLVIKNEAILTFHNVLVGDVWLCSGQSNMEYTLDRRLKKYAAPKNGTDPSVDEVNKTGKPPAIRYLYVERALNKFPELPTKGWADGNDTIVRYVSAIGYFFAKEIYEKTNIPIGIISSSWGGTRIEEWTPSSAYKQSKVFRQFVNTDTFRIDGLKPGQKYKGIIEPLIPFAIKGVLWYQGESNCMIEDQDTYPEKFRLFVNAWRTLFKDDNLPFYTVQISPYLYSARKDALKHGTDLLPKFWEAQTKCLSVANTGMVVTTDLVDNLKDIHPSYKWEIAHRLALQAMKKSYAINSIVSSGPVYQSAKRKKNKIVLSFSHTESGLISRDGLPLTWFSIAGKNGSFVNASAVIENNKVILHSTEIKKPKYVRFAWDESAQPNFFNKEGLPALPFRTDNFGK
ncbi:MAG: sialate O-acetylesterase [Chitinophagaceae bacterium]